MDIGAGMGAGGNVGTLASFSFLLFSSLPRCFCCSSSFRTAFNLRPSPSKTTLSSSPSAIPMPVPNFFPWVRSTHDLASSCVWYRMNTIPSATPDSMSICGSKEEIFPCALKIRRICCVGVRGDKFMISTAVGGGGPVEFGSYSYRISWNASRWGRFLKPGALRGSIMVGSGSPSITCPLYLVSVSLPFPLPLIRGSLVPSTWAARTFSIRARERPSRSLSMAGS